MDARAFADVVDEAMESLPEEFALRLDNVAYHIDPARRGEGQRFWRYEDMRPGPAFIERLARGDTSAT